MKKIILFVTVLLCTNVVFGGSLPNNIYFKAMRDEMNRTLKELHEKGAPKINFVSYKMVKSTPLFSLDSSLGSFYPVNREHNARLALWTTVSVGNNQQDSLGMDGGTPVFQRNVADSYDGIRRDLWEATAYAYFQALDSYQQKQTYNQQKNKKQEYPDVIPAVQSNYVEKIQEVIPYGRLTHLQELLQRLTDKGNQYSYINLFYISLLGYKKNIFYLNSNGGFYQTDDDSLKVTIAISYITEKGFRKQLREDFAVPLYKTDVIEESITQRAEKMLEEVKNNYAAKAGKSYIGPVLLKPHATATVVADVFGRGVINSTPLRSLTNEEDTSAGIMQDEIGTQILSEKINIYDRPKLGSFDHFITGGFSPIDDEGVEAKDLMLVQKGVLMALPQSTRPFATGIKSNGHARGNSYHEPRESLTNVVVEVEDPLSEEDLENALLQRCRERGLDFCYIVPNIPKGEPEDTALIRIYTSDGHKEYVSGLVAGKFDLRSLRRDIVAGGEEREMYHFPLPVTTSFIAPSILLDDMSLQVSKKEPDRKPFIKKP